MPTPTRALTLLRNAFTESEWKALQRIPEFTRAMKRLGPSDDPNHLIVGGSLLLIKKGRFEANVSVQLPPETED